MCCIARLTTVIPTQQEAPRRIGFPPDLTSFTTLLFRPIAAIAMIMKNLDSSFNGANTSAFTPRLIQIVVIIDAITKYRMNIGNAFFKLNPFVFCSVFAACLARTAASTNVIGIIASVLVSFTVTALLRVSLPRFHMLSHVDAAAVTEDVSLMAVPANIPNASPCNVSKPMALPRIGKNNAANTLKKKITAIA